MTDLVGTGLVGTGLVGTVVRLQVQRSRLKPGQRGARTYDPAPLLEVPALDVGPDGFLRRILVTPTPEMANGEILAADHILLLTQGMTHAPFCNRLPSTDRLPADPER